MVAQIKYPAQLFPGKIKLVERIVHVFVKLNVRPGSRHVEAVILTLSLS